MPTYEITGNWTGPSSPAGDWTRFQHCERVRTNTKTNQAFVDAVRSLGFIEFTDGTALVIRVEDVTGIPSSKRNREKPQYRSLIRKCVRHGVNRVEDLPKEKS